MTTDLAELQQRFSIARLVRFESGPGALIRAVVTTDQAEAEIHLHGAHVTRYVPRGQTPVLWMSGSSAFQAEKPIRGGVPICFPWFGARAGDATSPAHGFARILEWGVESTRQDADGSVSIVLALEANEQTRKWWPFEFRLRYEVKIGSALQLALAIENRGSQPMVLEEALHSYFTVGDVRACTVTGLEGARYIDKTDGMKIKEQGEQPVTISAETDRVYLKTQSTCVIDDRKLSRRIVVAKRHSDATVVWNPWVAKSKAMADFGDDEWPGMICVETCNVGQERITVEPGGTHTMEAEIHVEAGN